MALAYSLLVGLTEVNPEAEIYRKLFHGFDGRRGCEGCARDVELMRTLTHYLGYEPVMGPALLNERATRENLLGALSHVAEAGSGFKSGDILFLYLSCHGRTIGPGPVAKKLVPTFAPDHSEAGYSFNMFMLHNGPVFNFEILQALFRLPEGARVFIVVDSCHAGIGSRLDIPLLPALAKALRFQAEKTRATFRRRPGIDSGSVEIQAIQLLETQIAAVERNQNLPLLRKSVGDYARSLIKNGGGKYFKSPPQITHLGAARDELTAKGGPGGSLFTRLLHRVLVEAVQPVGYDRLFDLLRSVLPPGHEPVLEPDDDLINENYSGNNPRHFSRMQHAFQIEN